MTNALDRSELQEQIDQLNEGDTLIIPVRTQNACVFARRLGASTIYESFEVDPPNEQIMASSSGRLVRQFPGPAFEIIHSTNSSAFQQEIAAFLADMDVVNLESAAITSKAGSHVFEARDTADPHYITHLLTSIIHGCPDSKPADVERVIKRVRNEILWDRAYAPWRRSPLWLIIRVAIQTTLRRGGNDGHTEYKSFMIFLLADIILSGNEYEEFTTDILVCIQDKIVRRLRKLSSAASPALVHKATEAVGKAKEIIEARWKEIRRRQAISPPWSPDELNLKEDTVISLLSSKEYLCSRLRQNGAPITRPFFTPSESRRLDARDFFQPRAISTALSQDPFIALADVEQFSVQSLDSWVAQHLSDASACVDLGECIIIYANSARSQYKDNPEDQSLMLLTVFLLWSALDQLAVSQHPLLADYSPEIPERILEPILLRKCDDLKALVRVQSYIHKRHNHARHGSVFSDSLKETSFPIRHFRLSSSLQSLKRQIEATAESERNQKRKEFSLLKAQQIKLGTEAERMEHGLHGRGICCKKCSLAKRAAKIRIAVHEWPLPQNKLSAEAVVFEMRCPVTFQSWRTTTYTVLYDFCRPNLAISGTSPRAEIELMHPLSGLRSYCHRQTRITYASPTKTFIKAHYSKQKVANLVASNLSSILVNHGAAYSLFDTTHKRWAKNSFTDCTVETLCRFELPSVSPYYALQYAINTPAHSANQPLADQAIVQPELSVHEHVAFGTLRSGPMIQWFNILRELRARTLSFETFEVHMLLMQAVLHTGEIVENELVWHAVLTQYNFGLALLSEIESLMSTIEGNWHQLIAMLTLVIIIIRLLACSVDDDIICRACSILRMARTITFSWVVSLNQDLNLADNEDNTILIRRRVYLAAAACRATYDVDIRYFHRLISSDADVSCFIQCAIIMQDNEPLGVSSAECKLISARDRRLSRNVAQILWTRTVSNRTGLDAALLAIWADYRPGLDWQQLAQPNERWLTTATSTGPESSSKQSIINYNLFDGTLLIDGKPIGRLPASIVRHPTYIRLLGHKLLDVVPSTLPTMHFATRNPIVSSDLFLHFQLPAIDGSLVIQATHGDDVFEFVPHTVFDQAPSGPDFPKILIDEYAHWLCLSSTSNNGSLTFHPLGTIWRPSDDNWQLDFTVGSTGRIMKMGESTMVDIRSKSFGMVSKLLEPLEVAAHIYTTVDTKGTLTSRLPRFKMDFFVNQRKELECSTIRDMVVDLNQSSGTMFGLKNQLILRHKSLQTTRIAAPGSRCVVIPFGKVNFQLLYGHSRIHISLDPGPQQYFTYDLDNTLERLTGKTLLSDIYKAYLHACTSFPLPDDLTRRTGTQEALCQLGSARFFSFQSLSPAEVGLLLNIGKLTPTIEWYPNHLRVMQTIHWQSIPPLVQHWDFASRVDSILRFQEELTLIHAGVPNPDSRIRTDSHLLARFRSRTSGCYLHPKGYFPRSSDLTYPPSEDTQISRRIGRPEATRLLVANISAATHSGLTTPSSKVPDLWVRLESAHLLENEDNHSAYPYPYRMLLDPCLTRIFIPLYNLARRASSESAELVSKLVFTLSIVAYTAHSAHMGHLISTFLAFARPEFRLLDIPPPLLPRYDLSFGVAPDREALINLLHEYSNIPPDNLGPVRNPNESKHEYAARRKEYWDSLRRKQEIDVANMLVGQWPCKCPSIPVHDSRFYLIDMSSSSLKDKVYRAFLEWSNNMNFRDFIDHVQSILDGIHTTSTVSTSITTPYQIPSLPVSDCCFVQFPAITLENLLLHRNPPTVTLLNSRSIRSVPQVRTACKDLTPITQERLTSLVEQFKTSSDPLQRDYGKGLQISLESFQNSVSGSQDLSRSNSMLAMNNDYELRRCHFNDTYRIIQQVLSPQTLLEIAIYQAGQWPILTIKSFLELLSKCMDSDGLIPSPWKATVVVLAQVLLQHQRSRRVLNFKILGLEEDLHKELNIGNYETDVAFNNPLWLLIQIDSNFTVRPVQSRVAQEMISPLSEENSLTQLNMGEGKSAVIVPLVSSALADGHTLVRVITLKSLVNQTFDLLVRRLSGLAGRKVLYLPFSRDFKADVLQLERLQQLYKNCVHERGVLLVQPEHVLSLRLMGIDFATEAHKEVAKSLLDSYRWLSLTSRDILDESDEILRANYQLVYTSGLQEPMDNHPDRWLIIQELIGYAQKHAETIHLLYPIGLEVQREREAWCPVIRILEVEAGEALLDSVISEVLSSERFKVLPSHNRLAASDFLRGNDTSATALKSLRTLLNGTTMWKYLLLYRGLLGRGLLHYVLREKRWRVDYGLDLTRTLLAVPYRAKDLPSPRADFGHPDVALALTCLSYYYGGLSEEQLDHCLELLLKLDDPPTAYSQWVYGRSEVPPAFRDIKGVNLDDQHQRKSIIGPLFRRYKVVIDFYLSSVVFPRYAKQFPKKLSASSWDLAEIKTHLTTGFSGTNDNRYLLPTSIQQDTTISSDNDPFGQRATNAKVLNILLQPENDNYYCLCGNDGQSPTGSDYLELLVKQTPPVRVLLDVGAQMLDMQNTELVSKWMSLAPEFQAIVFFNEADELVVMSRDGYIEKLVSSQFNQKLDLCAVYLDDAHTRGTDLKLPNDFRAVVTLGPKLVKDRLVQGCMRMRQLGRGQSVIFLAPLEVDRSIRACALFPLEGSAQITAADILRWTMWNTCAHIQRCLPHWAQQGIEYKRRNDAWILHESDTSAPNALQTLRSSWEEPDARTLEEMYEEQPNQVTSNHPAFELPHLRERLDYLGCTDLGDPKADEEQERQVAKEAERERQRELPPKVQPATSNLHEGLNALVKSGTFNPMGGSPFAPLFSPLDTQHKWSVALFSTQDFVTTIKGGKTTGDYLRPVNWILSVPAHQVLIVISPFEANALLPAISKSKHVHLHIYTPRVNKNMQSTEDLSFFSVPALPASTDPLSFITEPMMQLNLWAGQLYLKDLEMYTQLCRFLGLIGTESGPRMWDIDGFVKAENRTGAMKKQCQMVLSPVAFLKLLFNLRRKGMGYEATHMGKILNAKPLELKEFEH
ncbi:hypothetical protein H0H87_005763 [Tephrocybe sp. NHM501043]|nr:hypothetical protein H0H87_005763 [Tephrocybe sp. NHM501043]